MHGEGEDGEGEEGESEEDEGEDGEGDDEFTPGVQRIFHFSLKQYFGEKVNNTYMIQRYNLNPFLHRI